jgi:beta-glucanase (GH16 family)
MISRPTLLLLLLALLPLGARAVPLGYVLTFADEFDGTALDTSVWDYRLSGPRRDAVNTPDAVHLDGDGHLVIDTWTAADGTNYTGMVGTQGRFEQRYGYFEARIDFDGAPGMWSAFWLQSPTMGQMIGDPAHAGVEMDVVEHDLFASVPSGPYWHAALHWDGYGSSMKAADKAIVVPDIADGFHTFGLEWTSDALRFYYDDRLMWSAPKVISQVPEFMILSSEVMDSFLSQIPEGGYGDRSESTTRMSVDWVHVYSAVPEPATGALFGAGLLALARGRERRVSSAARRSGRASTRP